MNKLLLNLMYDKCEHVICLAKVTVDYMHTCSLMCQQIAMDERSIRKRKDSQDISHGLSPDSQIKDKEPVKATVLQKEVCVSYPLLV